MFITSVLVAGASMVVLDNISGRLDSAPLARVLTVDIWEDRLLGVRRQVRRLNRAVWVATGKPGVAVAGGGARRSEDTGRAVPGPPRGRRARMPDTHERVGRGFGEGQHLGLAVAGIAAWISRPTPPEDLAPPAGGVFAPPYRTGVPLCAKLPRTPCSSCSASPRSASRRPPIWD
jgi:hypothetical protein